MLYILPLILIVVIVMPLLVAYHNLSTGKKTSTVKRAILINLSAFAVICLISIVIPIGGFVSAASVASGSGTAAGFGYIAAALSTGIACIAAGIAVSNGSSAAIGAVTEDPKVFGRAMIFVVLGEGIAIYGMVISIMILGKIQ